MHPLPPPQTKVVTTLLNLWHFPQKFRSFALCFPPFVDVDVMIFAAAFASVKKVRSWSSALTLQNGFSTAELPSSPPLLTENVTWNEDISREIPIPFQLLFPNQYLFLNLQEPSHRKECTHPRDLPAERLPPPVPSYSLYLSRVLPQWAISVVQLTFRPRWRCQQPRSQ